MLWWIWECRYSFKILISIPSKAVKQNTISRVYQYTHWVYTQKLGLLGHRVVLQTDFISIELCFISLCRCCIFFFFNRLKVFGNPALSKSIGTIICLLPLLMSHFGNSCNISNFSIIIFVMVTCDLYYCKKVMTHWRLRWWLDVCVIYIHNTYINIYIKCVCVYPSWFVEVNFHCDLYFPNDYWCWVLFSYLLVIYILSWENICSVPLPILESGHLFLFCFLALEL